MAMTVMTIIQIYFNVHGGDNAISEMDIIVP